MQTLTSASRELFRRSADEQFDSLDSLYQRAQDDARYRDLIERGADALSKYDREIAHAGDDDLAWASAIALKYNHISGILGRISLMEQLASVHPDPKIPQKTRRP